MSARNVGGVPVNPLITRAPEAGTSERWSDWREAPQDLMDLLRVQAARNGTEIVRDREVRLNCIMPEGDMITFLVFWPGGDAMNVRLLRPE